MRMLQGLLIFMEEIVRLHRIYTGLIKEEPVD